MTTLSELFTMQDIDALVPTIYRGWTPANLSTLPKLWFHDGSRFNLIGGDCSSWEDMGSLGIDFAQANVSARPTMQPALLAGRNVLQFDGTNDVLGGAGVAPTIHQNVDYAWIAALYYLNTVALTDRVLFASSVNVGTGTRVLLSSGITSGGTARIGGRRLDADGFVTRAQHPVVLENQWVMALGIMDYGADSGQIWVDGTLSDSRTAVTGSTGSTSNTASAYSTIGAFGSASGYHPGNIAELLVGASAGGVSELSVADIDKIFGYLAHKWGLVDKLPASHVYKAKPPASS